MECYHNDFTHRANNNAFIEQRAIFVRRLSTDGGAIAGGVIAAIVVFAGVAVAILFIARRYSTCTNVTSYVYLWSNRKISITMLFYMFDL